MPSYLYYILIVVFVIVAAVGTFAVGLSKENKEGNPQYDKKTRGYWTRLTLYYTVTGLLALIALIWYVTR